MSGNAFASDFPGRGAWGPRDRHHGPHHHHHRHGCGAESGRHDRAELESALQTLAGWIYSKAKGGRGRHGRPSPEDIENLIALRRMRGGPFGAEGPFGPGPWGPGPGPGRGRGRGRGRARRGDVRLALLRLLAEEPRNGYQLMQTIEERSGGRWRPSPGSVYPTLAQLEDEGLVRSREADGARHFEITDSGRTHLTTRGSEPDPWASSDEESESVLMELGPLVLGIGKAAWQVASVGDEAQRARATEVLAETRRTLYGILAAQDDTGDQDDTDDGAQADATED
ncbi:MAG TPA: PadR family transcriptional regulator [Solirubrobacteraceae bacterium]|nr:PadR family transcriptional regulator [Solirubrobacteraceae bacterium]